MTPAPDTLKLAVGESHVIALQYAEGKPCTSRFSGAQIMYSLVDGRKLFVDEYVATRIRALGVGPGDEFSISKQESFAGNRRTVEVVVRPLRRAGASGAAPATNHVAGNGFSQSQATVASVQCPVASADASGTGHSPVSGAGETHAAIMARCYCSAVDIALATIACAEKKGLRLSAQFEDVRAMGTALLIAETGGRR
jgi:hypothetical protein